MPIYTYECKSCQDTIETSCPMKDRDLPTQTPCEKCGGQIYQTMGVNPLADPISLGIKKPDEGFRDRLRDIKRTHPGSKMNIL